MIVVAGWLRVDPANRQAYLEGCVAVIEAARRAEGCLDFALSADVIEPDRINVFEKWSSEPALEAFRGSGPDDGQSAMILAADVSQFEVRPVP